MLYQPRACVVLVVLALSWLGSAAMAVEPDSKPQNQDDIIRKYCLSISDKAAEARVAWLNNETKKLQDDVVAKIAALEVRGAEVKMWVEKRQALLQLASQSLVEIYTNMDPEAAAAQLAEIDIATGASILRQLKPRGASAILDVMPPEKAAMLIKAISAAARDENAGKGS